MSTVPDVKMARELILAAPIGDYIGLQGAKILAERVASVRTLKDGEFLFHGGEQDNSFFIVIEGQFLRVKESKKNRKPRVLHILEKGDLVGELSFIDNTPYATSTIAVGDASVLEFKDDDIRPLIVEEPQFMFNFMRGIIKRVHCAVATIGQQKMDLSDYIATAGKGRL